MSFTSIEFDDQRREMRKSAITALLVIPVLLTACAGSSVPAVPDVSAVPEVPAATDVPKPEVYEVSVSEQTFIRDGKKIFGKLYMPKGEGKYPAVILSHAFGANLSMMEGYADAFARNGIIAYAFDFIGGGHDIKSDGVMEEMSVLTEAADLDTVLDGICELDKVDKDNVFLMGASQGGFVSTYVAGTRPERIKGLIAFYPAYVLQDDAKKRTNNGADMKDTFSALGATLSRVYDEDAMSFDIYNVMKKYDKKALILHGTADTLVPLEYSERAAKTIPNATLIKIEGAGHGFGGADDKYATDMAVDFVKECISDKKAQD